MKRIALSILLILSMIVVPLAGYAEVAEAYAVALAGVTGNPEEFYVDYIGEAALAVDRYIGSESNLILPDVEILSAKIDSGKMNLKADAIGYEAFAYNGALQTLVIPEGYCYIKERAFFGCENLTTVVLPSTLVGISYEAFAQCTSLTNIIFPNGSYVHYIEDDAFAGCDQMTMTEEEINDLIDESFFEALEEKAAQQAAFVVDENALTELAVYLATDIYAFGEQFGGREFRDSDRWGYSLDELTVTSIYSWEYIEEMSLHAKCNYSLCGVYVSMDMKEARNLLLKSGWKMESKFEDSIIFIDKMENYLFLDFNENNEITEVGLALNINTVSQLEDDEYDGSPVIQLPGSDDAAEPVIEEAVSVIGRTTGNVNMRSSASLGGDVVCVIPANSSVEYIGEESIDDRGVAWYLIRYDGYTGWCSSKHVELP